VITSHDRWFLDRVATHILAWEGGANWYWFEGNFASYEQNKATRLGEGATRPRARPCLLQGSRAPLVTQP
jgi:ATPase subunit of ABC transporter with duplicated ATPase domains